MPATMAGHSKWKQIKRQKAIDDGRRGALFTKLGREITVAARTGGGPDPAGNARLRLALLKARESNMPFDIIDRAIKKAVGESDASQLDDVVYEGYAPGAAAILVEAVTDNRNRTVSDIRVAFSRGGGRIGETGSVAWVFSARGVISLNRNAKVDPEAAALVAIDAGAEDFSVDDDAVTIFTKPEELEAVRKALVDAGYEPAASEVEKVPSTTVPLGEEEAIQTLKLLDRLEDLDDVQRVYSNADFPDAVIAAFGG